MDFKDVFNKQIAPLPTQMQTSNWSKLIDVMSLTSINSSHTLRCVSLGLVAGQRVTF